jgi:hypothetical protein
VANLLNFKLYIQVSTFLEKTVNRGDMGNFEGEKIDKNGKRIGKVLSEKNEILVALKT